MALTLAQLADQLGAELRGDGSVPVSAVATLEQATASDVSFLANPRYRRFLATTRAAAVILTPSDSGQGPANELVLDDPYRAYGCAVRLLSPPVPVRTGIHPNADVDNGATVHPSAWVDAFCQIGAGARIGAGAQLGPGCIIGPGVTIGDDTELVARVTVLAAASVGARTLIHPGVVIGSDGFGLARTEEGWEKIPQVGGVSIGDEVEIGANTTVDRGALGDTVIERGVKIDNQVQIAHNVHIGAHTAIAACVGISGSTSIGRHCMLAGGAGVIGHLRIADNVTVTGMSMVTHSIHQAGVYSAGTPLMHNRQWRRNAVRMKRLDELFRRVKDIKK